MFAPEVVEPTVDLLAELAGGGAALELAIGTGRIALPLRQRGVRVAGIDLSPDMVAQLRTKPGSEDIEVTIGDSASATVAGTFTLAYLVWNSIMNLTTQAEQVDCFRNVARHLAPRGRFVVEVLVPDLQRLPRGDTIRPFTTSSHLGFDEYDVVTQALVSHHYWLGDGTDLPPIDSVSLRVARGARSHGPPRRNDPRAAVVWLESGAVPPPRARSSSACWEKTA